MIDTSVDKVIWIKYILTYKYSNGTNVSAVVESMKIRISHIQAYVLCQKHYFTVIKAIVRASKSYMGKKSRKTLDSTINDKCIQVQTNEWETVSALWIMWI